jgi:23S rRNA (guanosine2251-2'-O)-methyltransferase
MKPPSSNRHGAAGRPPGSGGQGGPGMPFRGRPQDNQHRNRPRGDFQRPRLPDTPRGALWLYGLHAVAAALANPARRLRHLMLTEEAQQTLTERQPPPWPVPPEQVERGRLDHLLGRDIAHQGVALLADPLATPSLQHALERPGPLLVLDQVTDPRNVGAILRSAAAFGVAAVITQDRNAPEETGSLAKAASGALETIPLLRAVNIARTLIALKAAGLWTVGLDAGGAMLSGPSLHERRVALVLGAEGEGLRRLTRETCDEIAGLRMPGKMESLNVSVAASVALYELTRRT